MDTISMSICCSSAALSAGFEVGKNRALEFPGPAPCIRAMFPCQPVALHFFVRRLCLVEDRQTPIAAALGSSRARRSRETGVRTRATGFLTPPQTDNLRRGLAELKCPVHTLFWWWTGHSYR